MILECADASELPGMADERLEWHLWNWEQWHYQQKGHYGRGYPKRAHGPVGASGSSDFDGMVAAADKRCALAVEAILDGLPPAQRCAVHAIHLCAVFRFPRLNLQACYDRGTEAVRRGLVLRGIV